MARLWITVALIVMVCGVADASQASCSPSGASRALHPTPPVSTHVATPRELSITVHPKSLYVGGGRRAEPVQFHVDIIDSLGTTHVVVDPKHRFRAPA